MTVVSEPENSQETQVILSLVDPLSFNVKHKLQHRWTLWYDDPAMAKANPKENWEDNLKNIATFESVEDFWGLLNNLKKPSEIPAGSNYHLFKAGIKPMWEVEENKMGGKWTYSQDRKKRGPELNQCWMHTMLKMIGQQFTNNEDIRGAVVSIRKNGDRISLWTGSFNDAKKTIAAGTEFKSALQLPPSEKLSFYIHKDTSQKSSSSVPTKYSC